jgi:hypothetical protein
LNDSRVAQRPEHLGRLLLEECFFPAVFADEPNALQQNLTDNLPG